MVKLYIRTEITKHVGNKDNKLFPKYSQEAFRCPGGPILNSHVMEETGFKNLRNLAKGMC